MGCKGLLQQGWGRSKGVISVLLAFFRAHHWLSSRKNLTVQQGNPKLTGSSPASRLQKTTVKIREFPCSLAHNFPCRSETQPACRSPAVLQSQNSHAHLKTQLCPKHSARLLVETRGIDHTRDRSTTLTQQPQLSSSQLSQGHRTGRQEY